MPTGFRDDFNAALHQPTVASVRFEGLDVHQREKSQRPLGMIEKQIYIGILACLAPRSRAEQVEMHDTEPLQLGLMLLEPGNGFAAFHRLSRRQQSTS